MQSLFHWMECRKKLVELLLVVAAIIGRCLCCFGLMSDINGC
jgi:hypothetical protein